MLHVKIQVARNLFNFFLSLIGCNKTKATDSGQPITCHDTYPTLTIGHLNISPIMSKSAGQRHGESRVEGREQMSVNIVAKLLFWCHPGRNKGAESATDGPCVHIARWASHCSFSIFFLQSSTKSCVQGHFFCCIVAKLGEVNES